MEKIRLAHLVNSLGYAGKEAGIIKICSHMDRETFDIDVIVLEKIYRKEQLDTDNFRTVLLKKRPGNDVTIFRRLGRFLRENKYDIVYSHAWNTLLEGYIGGKLARTSVKIHGEHGTFERSPVKDRIQRKVWGKFDAVTVVAGDLQHRMRELFGYTVNNVEVIHNGIDAQRFFPSPEWRAQFKQAHNLTDHFVVGTVGRFHPVKDHFTLFRGFARFKASVPHAKLAMVGPETDKTIMVKYRQLLSDLQITDDVLFIPPTNEVEKMLNGFDVFVLSSISEGCSNVILEALACAVPVVATRTGGNPELIQNEENGLLFPVGDGEALAEALLDLYENQDFYQRMQLIGPELIRGKFTLQKSVRNYENLYIRLLEEKRGSNLHWAKTRVNPEPVMPLAEILPE